jgi:hypothetical protein
MKKAIVFVLSVIMMMITFVSQAHPGHGSENPLSPGHYVFNPEHAAPIVLALVVSVIVSWLLIVRSKRQKS